MQEFTIEELPSNEVLTYRHEFAASPAEIYDAFVNPQTFVKWFGPADWAIRPETLTLEPVTGGRKQFVMRHKHNKQFMAPMYMRFVKMKEPSLLEYREALPDPAGQPTESLVALRLEIESGTAITEDSVGEGTIVKLTQGPLPESVHQQTIDGWAQSFEELAKHLAKAE